MWIPSKSRETTLYYISNGRSCANVKFIKHASYTFCPSEVNGFITASEIKNDGNICFSELCTVVYYCGEDAIRSNNYTRIK